MTKTQHKKSASGAATKTAASKRAKSKRAAVKPPTKRGLGGSSIFIIGAIVVAVTLIGIAVQATRSDEKSSGPSPEGLTETSGVLVGDPDAPVTIDIFADMLCPACRAYEEATGDTIDELVDSGEANVRYHLIAILDRASTNSYSTRAASAAYCTADTSAFPDYLKLLYAQQPAEGGPGHENDVLADYAAQAGATGSDVADCIADERYAGFTTRVTDEANKDGVTGTPTVRVDGVTLEDRTPEGLLAAVEAATQ